MKRTALSTLLVFMVSFAGALLGNGMPAQAVLYELDGYIRFYAPDTEEYPEYDISGFLDIIATECSPLCEWNGLNGCLSYGRQDYSVEGTITWLNTTCDVSGNEVSIGGSSSGDIDFTDGGNSQTPFGTSSILNAES